MITILQLSAEDLRAEIKKCFQESLAEINNSPTTPILNDRCDLSEACNITGLKKSSIYRLSMDNLIPFQKYGKRLVFSRKSLLEWIESRTIGTQEASDTLRQSAIKKLRK